MPTSPVPDPLPCADTRDAVWVRHELVGEVAYTEWTADRQASPHSMAGLRVNGGRERAWAGMTESEWSDELP